MKCTFAVEFYRTVKTLENCQFLHPSCFQINFQTILLKWMSQIIQDSLRGKKYGLTSTSQLYAFSLSILFNHTPVQQKPFLSSHIQTLLISLGAHISVLGTAEAWFFLSFIVFTNRINSVTHFRLSISARLHSGRGEAVQVIPDFLATMLFLMRSSPAFQGT